MNEAWGTRIEDWDPKFFADSMCEYLRSSSPLLKSLIKKQERCVCMTRAEDLLYELKMKQARRYQDETAYNAGSYDQEGLFARLPRMLNRFLLEKLEPGCIYYGWVDIFNTSLIFVCRAFNYNVEEDVTESANEFGGDTVEIACDIDYESIRESRFVLQIHEFNQARYANRTFELLDDIITRLRFEIDNPEG